MTAMKALSLHQPYASLVAVGVKSIETRSWATKYRGPLLIHAAKRRPDATEIMAMEWAGDASFFYDDEWYLRTGLGKINRLPLGVVVASCQLADCVPITQGEPVGASAPRALAGSMPAAFMSADRTGTLRFWRAYEQGWDGLDATPQLPFGDFSPGRYAWLLGDVKPTTERCPRCWGGTRCPGWHGTDAEPAPCLNRDLVCATCAGALRCEPIPMRGQQRLWTPTWEAAS